MRSYCPKISRTLSESSRVSCSRTSTRGLISLIESRALSALDRPTSEAPWMIWRCRLDSSTTSNSTMPSVPTPAAARYISTGEPSPPAPTASTLAFFSRFCPSIPTSGMIRCRLYRRTSSIERSAAGSTRGGKDTVAPPAVHVSGPGPPVHPAQQRATRASSRRRGSGLACRHEQPAAGRGTAPHPAHRDRRRPVPGLLHRAVRLRGGPRGVAGRGPRGAGRRRPAGRGRADQRGRDDRVAPGGRDERRRPLRPLPGRPGPPEFRRGEPGRPGRGGAGLRRAGRRARADPGGAGDGTGLPRRVRSRRHRGGAHRADLSTVTQGRTQRGHVAAVVRYLRLSEWLSPFPRERRQAGRLAGRSRGNVPLRIPEGPPCDSSRTYRAGGPPLSYLSSRRFTISVIQTGANGDVQFGGVG